MDDETGAESGAKSEAVYLFRRSVTEGGTVRFDIPDVRLFGLLPIEILDELCGVVVEATATTERSWAVPTGTVREKNRRNA